MNVVESARLVLRRLDVHDARFILELLNDPAFIRFVGDRGVRDLADAYQYILDGPIASYRRFGFGLYLTSLRDGAPIGICGLLKRDALEDVDIGFAFLPAGRRVLGLRRIVAITAPDNHASIAVLQKIGMSFERMVKLSEQGKELKLFVCAG
jgi:RimJ/RimL family protein N-acetyltransferase